MEKSVLIFAHHGPDNILLTVESYLKELSKYFTKTIFVTDYQGNLNLPYTIIQRKNRARDFGGFYKGFENLNLEEWDTVALVNDSNSLVGSFQNFFDWIETSDLDMCGLTDSDEEHMYVFPWLRYHIQSHFLVFKKRAIPYLKSFFDVLNFDSEFLNDDNIHGISEEVMRSRIIVCCEYGLTAYMLSKGMEVGAKYSIKNWDKLKNKQVSGITKKGSIQGRFNIHLHMWEELIQDGYPVIKNKIVKGEWDIPKNEPGYIYVVKEPQNRRKYYKYE